jgi:hypothetical protein
VCESLILNAGALLNSNIGLGRPGSSQTSDGHRLSIPLNGVKTGASADKLFGRPVDEVGELLGARSPADFKKYVAWLFGHFPDCLYGESNVGIDRTSSTGNGVYPGSAAERDRSECITDPESMF